MKVLKFIDNTFLQDDVNNRTTRTPNKPSSKFRKAYFRRLRKRINRILDKQQL